MWTPAASQPPRRAPGGAQGKAGIAEGGFVGVFVGCGFGGEGRATRGGRGFREGEDVWKGKDAGENEGPGKMRIQRRESNQGKVRIQRR